MKKKNRSEIEKKMKKKNRGSQAETRKEREDSAVKSVKSVKYTVHLQPGSCKSACLSSLKRMLTYADVC